MNEQPYAVYMSTPRLPGDTVLSRHRSGNAAIRAARRAVKAALRARTPTGRQRPFTIRVVNEPLGYMQRYFYRKFPLSWKSPDIEVGR